MLKTYHNEKSGTTTAVITNSDVDAMSKVITRLGIKSLLTEAVPDVVTQRIGTAFSLSQLVMPAANKATVQVREGDTYNEDEGKALATKKAQQNYRRSLRKTFMRWQVTMLKKIYTANPETFSEAVEKTQSWITKQQK